MHDLRQMLSSTWRSGFGAGIDASLVALEAVCAEAERGGTESLTIAAVRGAIVGVREAAATTPAP